MGPPPSTPAPSRFLLSKRPHAASAGDQQSQAQRPNQQSSTGPQRFHPTPRFSTSTPRPPSLGQAATPALAIKPKTPRLRTTQDLIDDSSPLSEEEHDGPDFLPEADLPEPIEFDSSLVPQSSLPIKDEHEDDEEDFDPRPQPKRRRISITSLSPSPPLLPQEETIPITSPQLSDDDIEIDPPDSEPDPDPDQDLIASFRSSPPPQPYPPPSSSSTIKSEEDPESPILLRNPKSNSYSSRKKEPMFRPPPKFKQPAPGSPSDDIKPPMLPDTPHRHSKKQKDRYLPSGLASEVRDWLVDAKELFNPPPEYAEDETMPSSVQLKLTRAQHAAGGAGMVVVSAQQPGGGGEVNAILAGEGTAVQAGLDKDKKGGGLPKRGATVSIGMPAWDVDLGEGLGTWAVAYRWEVLKETEK